MMQTDSVSRLRGDEGRVRYVLPESLAGDYGVVVASSTLRYGRLRFHEDNGVEEVVRGRREYFDDINAEMDRAVFMRQVHGANVAVVTEEDCGRGVFGLSDVDGYRGAVPGVDAMITDKEKVFLNVVSADCAPVVVYDAGFAARDSRLGQRRSIGAAHAGWKGAAAGVVPSMIEAMGREYGTRPGELSVWIGPHIQDCCYDIDMERVELFRSEFGGDVMVVKDERVHLSLARVIVAQLVGMGVEERRIEVSEDCTKSDAAGRFASHREMGDTRRDENITTIGLV